MTWAFVEGRSVPRYYAQAAASIEQTVRNLTFEYLSQVPDEVLLADLVKDFRLATIKIDELRDVSASPYPEVEHHGSFDALYTHIFLPITPKPENRRTVVLRPEPWPGSQFRIDVEYLEPEYVLSIRIAAERAPRAVPAVKDWIAALNADVSHHMPAFLDRVRAVIKRRRDYVHRLMGQYDASLTEAGISVRRRPGAIEPVEVREREQIQLVRQEEQAGHVDYFFTEQAADSILGLIDRGGKGFETAPGVYAKLGEEDLRTIILGYLNAVFEVVGATGETFSGSGRADIVLTIRSRVVLIAECHKWDGALLYISKLEQLFGYVTWRQPTAIMVTFSEREDLTHVLQAADEEIRKHPSFRRDLPPPAASHRVSIHQHPQDSGKLITVHHLFFNLYQSSTSAGEVQRRRRHRA